MRWTILVLLSITLFVANSEEIVEAESENVDSMNEELKEAVAKIVEDVQEELASQTTSETAPEIDSPIGNDSPVIPSEEEARNIDEAPEIKPLEIDENGEAKIPYDTKPVVHTVFMPKECPYKTQKGDRLDVHVFGKVISTNREFTSSHRHGKTMSFRVGMNEVMPKMWDDYLLDMCPGEKRHMVIPSDYAWGAAGLPANNVGAHEDVSMDVELVTVNSDTHGSFNAPRRDLEKEPTFTPFKCNYTAREGDTLYMEYHGTLESSGEVFDSSYTRGGTFDFTLGNREAIQGWDQGLVGICAGQRLHMVIPSDYAYGNHGSGEVIPPGDSLVQDVKCARIVTVDGTEYVAEEETEIFDMKTLYMPQNCIRTPVKGDKVWVAYDGRLESTPEIVFDSSYQHMYGRTHPFVFEIGAGQAIEGFEELISQMCIGEKRHAVVPPSKAYGREGDGGVIPPDARLDYMVEIVQIDGVDGKSYFASSDKNITKVGNCEETVEEGDILHMQYQGYIQVTMDLFEKTKEGEDHAVELGKNQVFPDLEKHFVGMCSGEHATIVIPQEDAFGDEGHTELSIPPFASLVFDVQLTKIDKVKRDEL